jgi:2-amino-4-hydroxy-6-hydroxymethyldihydropteridine diphosphokinase
VKSYDVIVALGSNEGNRYQNLIDAKKFLAGLSDSPVHVSSIYESEPIGPSSTPYYNAVAQIKTDIEPEHLLQKFKEYEKSCGRDLESARWSSRIIDLDIIAYGKKIIDLPQLTIPHSEYSQRLFVLLPLQEVAPEWVDPKSGISLKEIITLAPDMDIKKMELDW